MKLPDFLSETLLSRERMCTLRYALTLAPLPSATRLKTNPIQDQKIKGEHYDSRIDV